MHYQIRILQLPTPQFTSRAASAVQHPNVAMLVDSYRLLNDNVSDHSGASRSNRDMMTLTARPIRIAGASGSASDRRHAIAEFARHYPTDPVNVIIADFMSEFNMATAAGRRVSQGSAPAALPSYDLSFLEALEPALEDLAKHGIKLAVNAGVADTEGLYETVARMVQSKALDLKVAWVSGDEVLPAGQSAFQNVYTGERLADWAFEPIYAQCYLGGLGIAAALTEGADIVLCGRVSDASPVIGAAYWYHGWRRDELDKLANALVAGHLIECSNYVCGGNFTGFKTLEHGGDGWANIGYPIAEISAEGDVVITKQAHSTSGAVTVDTCTSQLLYEIQGPWYYNSDVTAVLDGIHFEQRGLNRVAVHGVRSGPPPPTTKVGITARGGFQAEAWWFLAGLDIEAKARMLEVQIRRLLAPYADRFTSMKFDLLGSSLPDANDQNRATVPLRIIVQAKHEDDLAPRRFLKPITDNIMQGYPGATFHLDTRQGFPRASAVQHCAHLPWKPTARTKILEIPPPPHTKTYPSRQPSQATIHTDGAVNLTRDFGPTVRGPLGWIVHARSGDKGSDANCGFWVRQRDEYLWLRTMLSVNTARELLGETGLGQPQLAIERFELPGLHGVHFLFRNLLDRGVGVTTTVDFLGKNVAEFLRARYVDLPVRFLNRGKL
ncbi:uncharacterized protein N7459_004615 [Penicillium hispanicum]|uniref:uncharacterized protein n=1 Tax=Penicillium hispanicum TaxID=1080232 RepID=UPI002540F9EB|nr:uncharacterized protein N7459_004615 [Penicillium hispanicum]KAJ5584815.1 hypothetical protein N7459_004615 [Penicillium hispanicum]